MTAKILNGVVSSETCYQIDRLKNADNLNDA